MRIIFPIPRIINHENDEMFLSWLLRLSRENEIQKINTFIQYYLYPNDAWDDYSNTTIDHRVKFEYFWQALKYVHNMVDECNLFLNTSIFTGIMPFLSCEQRQRYLNQAFNVNIAMEPLFPNPHGTINNYYICPKCAEEELTYHNYFFLHRSHHLPGVTVCHKHKCPLGKITKKIWKIDIETMPNYKLLEVQDVNLAYQFAVFSKDFMDRKFDCSLDELAKLIKDNVSKDTAKEMEENGLATLSDKDINYFLKTQLNGKYINQKTAIATLMHLFGDVDVLSYKLSQIRNNEQKKQLFIRELNKKGYSLCSAYREDIVKLCHNKCGNTFCTSPYGFLIGWECPICSSSLTLQEQYKKLIAGIGNSEYVSEDNFVSMDKPITIRHHCGKTLKMKARAFIYEGVHCDCNRRVDTEKAKEIVEKDGEFSLLEFHRTDKPMLLLHNKCGGTFKIYYWKFLESPRCRVCERKGHLKVRTTKDLEADIYDLTGEEYTLLSPYISPRKPVKIHHNICDTTQEYLAYRFLDGTRCKKCHIELTYDEFKDYVERYSLGKYLITGRPTRNLYRVHNNVENTDIDMTKTRVLQELRRPTPSSVLPLEKKDDSIPLRNRRKSEEFLSYLKNRFDNGIIFSEDIEYTEMTNEEIHYTLSNLAKRELLVHIATGIYSITKQYDVKDVIINRYLIRDGHHIGFLRGKSYAALIGISSEPSEWSIATNKESAKTPNRKIKFIEQIIHIKGSDKEITDNNYLILGAIDFFLQFRQYTDKSENEIVEAIRKYVYEENNGRLPERDLFEHYTRKYTAKNIKSILNRFVRALYAEGDICQ